MKKTLIYLLPFLCVVMACSKKTDLIFDGSVDERLQAALAHDSAVLVNSTYGWKAFLYPGNGTGAYLFYMEFKPDGSVTMMGDMDTVAATKSSASTYRLKAIQLPTLIFDTYNYIHKLSDPNPEVNGGVSGQGLYSDFEFSFLSVTADSIVLKGNKNGSSLLMVRASAEEQQDYKAGALKALMDIARDYSKVNKYLYLLYPDGRQMPFGLSVRNKVVIMQYLNESNEIVSLSSEFYFTRDSLHLRNPIVYKDYSFQDIYWDRAANLFYVMLNGVRKDLGVAPYVFQLALQPPLVGELFETYSAIVVEPDLQDGLPDAFLTIWNDCKTKMASGGRNLTKVEVLFPSAYELQLKFFYTSGASSLVANCYYSKTVDADGTAKFVVTANITSSVVRTALKSMTDYVANNRFYFGYPVNSGSTALLGGMFHVSDPYSYFFGELRK